MTKEEAKLKADLIGGWLSSGQGWADFSTIPEWKAEGIQNEVAELNTEEKRMVWEAFTEDMVIGDQEGTGDIPAREVDFVARTLGIKIEITSASWKEIA